MHHLLAGQDLAGAGLCAQPCRQVQRAAAVAALDRQRLAGIEPDADPQRKPRAIVGRLPEAGLQLDGGAQRLP